MKKSNDNEQNFWISYADLMAGLLFVFILLIGAIVIKYVLTQSDLKTKKAALEVKEKKVTTMNNKLLSTEDALKAIRTMLSEEQRKNQKANHQLAQRDEELEQNSDELQKNEDEITSLKTLLAKTQDTLISEQNTTKQLKDDLNQSEQTIKITKNELAKITQKLLESTSAHQKLVEDLNITKARIKNLTGIRIKAIQALKKKLGKNINIDPNSGAIRLSSSVLFDTGRYTLKPNAKKALKSTLKDYIATLLGDRKIRHYIENIVIEGYTDSDGTYLYNLALSQKRALAVLDFLYAQKGIDKKLLQRYVSASGRSFSHLIKKNGVEDKEASRRIEIKFSISNKKAIQEIESFLKSDHS